MNFENLLECNEPLLLRRPNIAGATAGTPGHQRGGVLERPKELRAPVLAGARGGGRGVQAEVEAGPPRHAPERSVLGSFK